MRDYLLPRRDVNADYETVVQTLDLTGEEADTIFDALSSQTSRGVFEHLYECPSTPSELADELDTSTQNVHYHLGKLKAADLIESVETVYSSRGVEIDVYAPTNEAIVLVTGTESRTSQINRLLSRFLGGVGILAIASLAIQYWYGANGAFTDDGTSPGPAPRTPTPTPASENTAGAVIGDVTKTITETPIPTLTPTPTPDPASVSAAVSGLPPGVLVFIGGVVILVLASFWTYRDMRR